MSLYYPSSSSIKHHHHNQEEEEEEEEEEAMEISPPLLTAKRKRTNRPRTHPPSPVTSPVPSSSSVSSSDEFSEPPMTEEEDDDDEEEDLANCLILLAQGRALTDEAAGHIYECKTCNKRFSSFQALGGHRASHKKPKISPVGPTHQPKSVGDDHDMVSSIKSIADGKMKVHECSICGLEFNSGQALGGHMRRHRPVGPVQHDHKDKGLLSLDLNLPAPDEDVDISNPPRFAFGMTEQLPVVFSALVDCHY